MSTTNSSFDDCSRGELIKLVKMQAATIERLEKRIEELEAKLKAKNPTERLDSPYSQKAEEKRQQDKGTKKPVSARGFHLDGRFSLVGFDPPSRRPPWRDNRTLPCGRLGEN
jgi:hypothetical protein